MSTSINLCSPAGRLCRYELGFIFLSVCVCTEFKISCKILNMLFVCLLEFQILCLSVRTLCSPKAQVMFQYLSCCVFFVQTCKAKQGFGYVELDEIREVTPARQNCDQPQSKGLHIKIDISVNMDVFSRRFTQFVKVALD
jgi:hypothetical protein